MILLIVVASVFAAASLLWSDITYSKELRDKAENGDMQAQFDLALCYQTGEGIKKDMKKAKFWYMKAAGQGHQEAGFILRTL